MDNETIFTIDIQETPKDYGDFRRSTGLVMTGQHLPPDPAFKIINKNATAFLIWRIENLQLVPVPKDQIGSFFEGDSYIIYAASEYGKHIGNGSKFHEVKGQLEMHVHFWLGKETSQDEKTVAAYKSVELDDYLGGSPIQHREVQGWESPRFLAYFKNGIRLLKGGVASGLSHVTDVFEPRLFRVKGVRTPMLHQMPTISWEYFNKGDVFIIDTKDVVFIWVGKNANKMEKFRAVQVAQQLQYEHKAVSLVFVDDGKELSLPDSEKVLLGVYLDLNGPGRQHIKDSSGDDLVADKGHLSPLKLYKCSDEDGTYKVIEIKTGPLHQQDLNTNDSFIVDNSSNGIWVWVGRKASKKERVEAMRNANGFVKKKNYPAHTPVTRVVEGGESTEFKALFLYWKEKDSSTAFKSFNNTGAPKKVLPTTIDTAALHEMPQLAAETQLIDDGSGTVFVWRVYKTELILLQPSCHGVFYAGDCYLIKYSYNAKGKERHILYYWMGLHSSTAEQTALAYHTVSQDDLLKGEAVQVRVVQSKEPAHFLAIFHGKMIIMSGDHKNTISPQFLLQVRGNRMHNTRATQVLLKASSLNSNDVFVLRTPSASFVWCGKGSTGDEREMAKNIANSMASSEYSVVYEGQEKSDFWNAIGGKEEYANSKRLAEVDNWLPARLFQCSNASGIFKVEEVVNFNQTDLVTEDVMLLDTRHVLFIWIGKESNLEERKLSMNLAVQYLKSDPAGRDVDTPIMVLKQGFEPPNFTGFFGVWDTELWKNNKSYDEIRHELEGQKPLLQVELKITNGTSDFDDCEKFPLNVLKQKDREQLPINVDALHKELHLSKEDFKSAFGMTYTDFAGLPKWKQENLKKTVGIF